jgi:transcriptional regulator with XRE-family HTH domain
VRNINTINGRIIQIIDEDCGGNRSEFARRLEITPTYAAQLYKGERIPGDRIVSSICREFHISREWLETGEGPMRLPEPDEDLDYINILMEQCDSPFKDLIRAILVAYDRSTPTAQKAINDYIDQILSELDKRK